METTTGFGLLSLVTFLPLIGAILLMCIPQQFEKFHKVMAMSITIATFIISLQILNVFESRSFHFQLVEFIPWIKQWGLHYRVGIDGISLWLVLLTTFLTVVATTFSLYVNKRVKAYMIMLLLLETSMLGVFVSLDLILFYAFFEASLIPMALMIWIWGGERRNYAAIKFFIFTFAGSIFMLIGMIALFLLHKDATGIASFSLIDIQDAVATGKLWEGAENLHALQGLLFWAFAVAFIVKCPMFPVHTWLPDAHVEAPTAGSIILAGVLLKMGTYGMLRFCLPLFPDVLPNNVFWLMLLATIGIIYGAIVAAVQPDVKKLVAYSSVAHMGFVVLGIFSLSHTGMQGGAMQQLNHGISTGALFLLIGLIYERRHTRMFKDFGGLKSQMPIFSALFLIIMLSSVGLPGTNGFIGEFLALMGAFESGFSGVMGFSWWLPAIAATGVILAAVYLLWMFQKMFYGSNSNPENKRLKDLKPWEIALVGTLVVFVFWGGLYPNTFLKPMESSIAATRLMALGGVNGRPSWKNLNHEVDPKGNLVQVSPRAPGGSLLPYTVERIVTPAQLHHRYDPPDMDRVPRQGPPQIQGNRDLPPPVALNSGGPTTP